MRLELSLSGAAKALRTPEAVRDCGRCYGELVKLERKEIQRAITGENYETIWGERGIREEAPVFGDDEDLRDDDEDDDVFDEDE